MNHSIGKISHILKQIVFICFLSVFSCFYSHSQSNTGIESVNSADQSNAIQEPIDTVAILRQIRAIEDHINAIDIKSNWINNNPEEKALAESNGWFIEMANIKSELIVKKSLLEEKLK